MYFINFKVYVWNECWKYLYGSAYFADDVLEQEDRLTTKSYTKTQYSDILLEGPNMIRFVKKVVNS